MLRLDSDVQYVKGVGPRRASLMASRDIRKVQDLLLHLPKSYQDRANFIPLSALKIGQDTAVQARVYRSRVIQTRTRGRILDVILTDGSSFVHAKWFHGAYLQTREFSAGREVVLFGRVDFDRYESKFVFFNPEFELLDEGKDSSSLDIGRYVPVYEAVGGITSRQLRHIIAAALADSAKDINDPLPEEILEAHGLPDLRTCLERVLKEIVDDLKAPYPMVRLLQGDVGSGKTIVAFEAIVIAVSNGYQAALMAPTEILAEQHFLNAKRILAPLNYRIAVVRRGIKKAEKQELLEKIASGEIQVIVGTHALLEERTLFKNLGMVIIDEQHRFGVVQRLQLMAKGENPNTLVMTATPIPRTLAMTLYGDLDLSVIDQMPPGRSPIRTVHVMERDAERIYEMIRSELKQGHQAYVVYPVIEESEKMDLKSATEGFKKLSAIFAGYRVALLHGRLKSEQKEQTMAAFAAGETHVLVSTTVIEVGVDVEN